MNKFVSKNIRYFDTTLRDGLQSYKHVLSLKEKTKLADYIYTTYKPQAIEVGSIVSEKFILKSSFHIILEFERSITPS